MQLVKELGKDRHHRKGVCQLGKTSRGANEDSSPGHSWEEERDGAECLTVSPAPRLKRPASRPASCPCRKGELQPTLCPTSLGGRSSTPVWQEGWPNGFCSHPGHRSSNDPLWPDYPG